MKAIVQDHYGGSSTLTAQDVARPAVGDDDVLVHVAAAGIDRGALPVMTGRAYVAGEGLLDVRVQGLHLRPSREQLLESRGVTQR